MSQILLIIPGIPYPPTDGHKLKIFNLINILNKYFEVEIVVLAFRDINEDEKKYLAINSSKFTIFKISKFQAFFNLILNIYSQVPFQAALYSNKNLDSYLKLVSGNFKFVILNLIRTFSYSKHFDSSRIILDMVDLISVNYKNVIFNLSPGFKKVIYKIEHKRLHKFELMAMKSSLFTLLVNHEEKNKLLGIENVFTIPNGVNENLINYSNHSSKYSNSIVFFGSLSYYPNAEAVLWIDKYLLDHINPAINVYVIGANPPSALLKIKKYRKNLIFTGFLDDPYLIVNSCFAVICPVFCGAGIQNKVLESMALGKLVILNTFSASPVLGAKNMIHFVVEDNPKEFADKINLAFENSPFYARIGENARNLIRSKYTWTNYEKKLLTLLQHYDRL